MGLPLHIIDAFAPRPFGGNPAAVCLLNAPASDEALQRVASELNLSETAFLLRRRDGYDLRWFTPKVEIELCGHATLASAHFLYTVGLADPARPIAFHTQSGVLEALPAGGGIELSLPSVAVHEVAPPEAALDALRVAAVAAFQAHRDLVILLEDEAAVRSVAPRFDALEKLAFRAIAVAAPGTRHDIVSRCFAPSVGIPEDPVTGSMHCALGPLFAQRLGKNELSAFQASTRGGELRVIVGADRVHLIGCCHTTVRGELALEVL